MFQPVTLFIALRYMRGKGKDRFGRFISWLSTIGITLGVIALIIVLSVMNGLENEIQKNSLYYMPQAILTSPTQKIDTAENPVSSLQNLDLNGVNAIVPIVTSEVVLQSAQELAVSRLIGVDPSQPEPIAPYVMGSPLQALTPNNYGVVIGRSLALQLGVTLGDQIRLLVPSVSQITPVGRLPSQRLFTIIGLFTVNRAVENEQVYIHQEDAARLMRYPENTITGWRLLLDNPLHINTLLNKPLPEHWVLKDWREQKGDFFQAVGMEKNMMSLLISLIIMVAAFNMITSLGLLVMDKQNEVAILQTQGLTPRQIMRIFMIQGAGAGVMGTLIGTLMGLLIALNLNQIRDWLGVSLQGIELPVLILPHQILFIATFSIVIALLSTLYPAWQAAKTQPAEALRYE